MSTESPDMLSVVLLNLSGFISILVIIGNIIMFIPSFVGQIRSNLKLLSIQYLFGSILCAIYINFYSFFKLGYGMPCKVVLIFRNCSILPLISSSACITVVTFLLLKKEHSLTQKSCLIRTIFILCSWVPPILSCIPLTNLNDFKYDNNVDPSYTPEFCNITCSVLFDKSSFPSIVISALYGVYALIAALFSVNIIYGICKLKKNETAEMSSLTNKIIARVIKYIIGMICFIVFHMFSVFQTFNKNKNYDKALPFAILVLCLMNPIMVYIFVWNNRFKMNFLSIYGCCRKDTKGLVVDENFDDVNAENMEYELENAGEEQ